MSWVALGSLTRELRDGELIVGSGADADWRVPTADLMPRHFTLTVHGLNVSIQPSTTDVVVVVNGKQLPGTYFLLDDGDIIEAGRGQFIYSDDEPRIVEETPSPTTEDAYLIDEQSKVAYRLVSRSTTLGRDASNGIVIRDPRASRFHAEIRREAGGFAVHTMGSAGTSLNGGIMRGPRLLKEGDAIEIAFGKYRFTRDALPQGVSIGVTGVGLNDEAAAQPTAVGPRATMESAVHATEPPKSVLTPKVIIGIVLIVVAAVVARLLIGR